MALGWKILIPVALSWVLLAAVIRSLRNDGYEHWQLALAAISTLTTVVLLLVLHRKFSALNSRLDEPAPHGSRHPFRGIIPDTTAAATQSTAGQGGRQWLV